MMKTEANIMIKSLQSGSTIDNTLYIFIVLMTVLIDDSVINRYICFFFVFYPTETPAIARPA